MWEKKSGEHLLELKSCCHFIFFSSVSQSSFNFFLLFYQCKVIMQYLSRESIQCNFHLSLSWTCFSWNNSQSLCWVENSLHEPSATSVYKYLFNQIVLPRKFFSEVLYLSLYCFYSIFSHLTKSSPQYHVFQLLLHVIFYQNTFPWSISLLWIKQLDPFRILDDVFHCHITPPVGLHKSVHQLS